MLVAPAFSGVDPSSDIQNKKLGAFFPIKCFCQVYGSAYLAHNIGDSELLPMEDLCLDFIFAEIFKCPLAMPSLG